MAFYRSGGGSDTETVLWTNGSPTSSFAQKTVTLSDNINNYDYIKMTFRYSTSDDTELVEIFPVENIDINTAKRSTYLGVMWYAGSWKYRNITNNYTSVEISNCVFVGGSSSNGSIIPLQIIGIKEA